LRFLALLCGPLRQASQEELRKGPQRKTRKGAQKKNIINSSFSDLKLCGSLRSLAVLCVKSPWRNYAKGRKEQRAKGRQEQIRKELRKRNSIYNITSDLNLCGTLRSLAVLCVKSPWRNYTKGRKEQRAKGRQGIKGVIISHIFLYPHPSRGSQTLPA
jgi:hypothetical protein